jgi:hypothetical protein
VTLSDEEIEDWVRRHLAQAPRRDDTWSAETMAIYLGESKSTEAAAA